jgi:hypothetical protein
MNREITKAPYCKPAIRVVEWDFNESICNSVITNSLDVNSCIRVTTKGTVNKIEKRYENPGEWHWTGSQE